MRQVQTFIMRLFVDPAEPHALRGSLYSVAHGDEYAFSNRASLIELLDHIIRIPQGLDRVTDPKIQIHPRLDWEQGAENE